MATQALLNDKTTWLGKLREARKAGDLRAEENAVRMLMAIDEAIENKPPEPTTRESIGRGFVDIGGGVRQLLPESVGGYSPEQNKAAIEDMRLYERGAGAGFDFPRMVGQTAALAPTMAAGMPAGLIARTATGAALGGASGAAMMAESPMDRTFNAAGGLAGGAIGSAVAPAVVSGASRGVGAVGRAARRAWDALSKKGRQVAADALEEAAQRAGFNLSALPAAARQQAEDEAARALRSGGALDADAVIRKARAASFGLVDDAAPTRGQLTRDPAQFSDEVNYSKIAGGEAIADRYARQRQRIAGQMDQFQDTAGVPGGASLSPEEAGRSAIEAAQKRASEWQSRVSALYDSAAEARPDALVSGETLDSAISDLLDEFPIDQAGPVIKRIRELSKSADGFAPKELEKLDKLITQNRPGGSNLPLDKGLRLLKERVRGLIDTVGEDYGGAYRDAVREASTRATAIGPRRQLPGALIGEVLEPEMVGRRVMGASLKEIRRARDFILGSSPGSWNQVRSVVVNDLIDAAIPNGETFSPAAYRRWLRKVGDGRLKEIFGADTAQQLKEFGVVVRDMLEAPAGNRINRSNTAPVGLQFLSGILNRIPGASEAMQARAASQAMRATRQGTQAALNPFAPAPLLPPPMDPRGLLGRLSRNAWAPGAVTGGLLLDPRPQR